MRKPTRKMIEALVILFDHRGKAYLPSAYSTSTISGLVERGLLTAGSGEEQLTDAGLAFLVDTRRAVVTADGTWVCANREPMSTDQVTAELIRFESDRAIEAETLAKADAIRERRAAAEAESDRVHEDANRAWANGIRSEVSDREERAGVVALFDGLADTVAALEAEEAEELSYRDAGLIEGTAAMLAEGRGSAIVNLADGGRAWTPVDRVGEFDRASRRAPDAAWERPARTLSELVAEFDDAVAQTVAAIPAGSLAQVTGFLRALNVALTPGEAELLDGVDTTDVGEGDWLAADGPSQAYLRADAAFTRARELLDRLSDAAGATSVTVSPVHDGLVMVRSSTGDTAGPVNVAVDPGAHISVRLTITRLRLGSALTSGDRAALADLLDTVRRALLPASDPNYNASWFDVSNTYRAHFGDTR